MPMIPASPIDFTAIIGLLIAISDSVFILIKTMPIIAAMIANLIFLSPYW